MTPDDQPRARAGRRCSDSAPGGTTTPAGAASRCGSPSNGATATSTPPGRTATRRRSASTTRRGRSRASTSCTPGGTADRIGVSNVGPARLEEAVERTDAPILANRVECHPTFQQRELRRVCAAHDVEMVAYSPLARGAVFEQPTLGRIADARGDDVSEARVALAWLRERGVTAVPKATSEAHILDDLASPSLELSDDEVDAIDAIDAADRQVDPDWAPWHAPVGGD